jgi:hypothetical protein
VVHFWPCENLFLTLKLNFHNMIIKNLNMYELNILMFMLKNMDSSTSLYIYLTKKINIKTFGFVLFYIISYDWMIRLNNYLKISMMGLRWQSIYILNMLIIVVYSSWIPTHLLKNNKHVPIHQYPTMALDPWMLMD